MNDYEKEYEKAEQFLVKHGLTLDIRANGTAIDPFRDTVFDPFRDGEGPKFHQYECLLRGPGQDFVFPFYTGMGWTSDPRIADVMHSIQGDCFAGGMTLADFMGDFGYESKQRGRLVWNACKANRQGVAAAMGAEAFQAFLSLEIEL